MNISFEAWKVQQAEIASKWLESNKSELSDVDTPEQGYGDKQGFEVPAFEGEQQRDIVGDIINQIALDEAQHSDYWCESIQPDNTLESGGIFNVNGVLACWKGTVQQDKATGNKSGDRFIAAKYPRHCETQAKLKARFGIEFCYNKAGLVRVNLPSTQETRAIKAESIAQIIKTLPRETQKQRGLARLQKRFA